MSKWNKISIGEFIDFNPSESIKKGTIARKIPMDKLGTFQRKINGSELSEYSSGPKFRNGDTLVAKITPCLENGKTALVDILNDKEVAFGSSEFIVLRENKNSDKNFIYYLSRSPLFRNKAISCMEGTSGRKRVNEGALKTQEILVPDLPTQQKIASVLSALDDKIELNNRINAELEAMAKTLYDYWFVQFDFPIVTSSGVEKPYKSSGGKMVYNEILKREIPEGWEVKKLEEIEEKIVTGKTPSTKVSEYFNGNIPFITIDDIRKQSFVFSAERNLTILGAESQANKYVYSGDICVSCIGTIGIIGIVATTSQTNQQINTISQIKDYNRYFLLNSLKNYFEYNVGAKKGAVLDNMNKQEFSNIPILDANKNLKKLYFDKVNPIYEKIEFNLKQNQELSALRDWLLPMLMNGQVKVG
ncbi:restriction endonuclease subunit S [Epilithonimonas vandammei]|uniref:Restriction endonuclease subunit S n=1 Tax=Epilithonimonas vandammei TaxID=2487072 RepID=A0A3G8ZDR3_9FLAO|nr:restriction endonuclease subunit S [Epilithonimonas vandammei]AZI54925.1 restriction endonuclease subunit S [Epilithonimonas vandammei]